MNDTATYEPEPLDPTADDYNALLHFRRRALTGPGALYVTLDDIILVLSYAATATTTFNVSLRMQNPRGEIIPVFYSYSALAQGLTATKNLIQNLEGFILSASVTRTSGSRGDVFVSMQIQRGVGAQDLTTGQVFLAGYPSAIDAIGYPQSAVASSSDGRALSRIISVANPAAGADVSITVPAGATWVLGSVSMTLVTSATVGNRNITLLIDDGSGHVIASIPMPAVVAASATETLTWSVGVTPQNVAPIQTANLPAGMRLLPGWRIRTVTTGIQVADQYSAIAIQVEQYVGQ